MCVCVCVMWSDRVTVTEMCIALNHSVSAESNGVIASRPFG